MRRPSTLAAIVIACVSAIIVPVALARQGVLDPPRSVTGGDGAYFPTFLASSSDGDTVAFSTSEPLDPADADDTKADLYVRWPNGALQLLTPGVSSVRGNPAEFLDYEVRIMADDSVAFLTTLPLVPEDKDLDNDVYLAHPDGSLTLVSAGRQLAYFGIGSFQMSLDGTTLAFTTIEDLLPTDTQPDVEDVYRYTEGTGLELVTVGDRQGWIVGLSPNGEKVLWQSAAAQADDMFRDDDGGIPDLFVSEVPFLTVSSPTFANREKRSTESDFVPMVSPDGRTIAVRTTQQLSSADLDPGTPDLYVFRPGAPPELLTNGAGLRDDPQVLRVCDSGEVLFLTSERLLRDADSAPDVYRRGVRSLTWMTPAGALTSDTGDGNDRLVASTTDCGTIAWTTSDADASDDTDGMRDLYTATDGGTPRLVSRTPSGGREGDTRILPSTLSSLDVPITLGSSLLFTSRAQLTPDDTDRLDDVFEWDRTTNQLTLVSSASGAERTDQTLLAATVDGDSALVETLDRLGEDDRDGVTDIYRYVIEGGSPTTPQALTPPPATPSPGTPAPTAAPTPLPTPVVARPAGSMAVTARQARVSVRRGRGTIATRSRVRCATGGSGPCKVTVRVSTKRGLLARRTAVLASGKALTIGVPLRKPALGRLRKAGKLTLTVSITLTRPGAAPVSKSFRAAFRAPR